MSAAEVVLHRAVLFYASGCQATPSAAAARINQAELTRKRRSKIALAIAMTAGCQLTIADRPSCHATTPISARDATITPSSAAEAIFDRRIRGTIGPLIANRKLSDLPPVAVNTVCLGAAAVVYAPFAALTWPRHVPSAQVLAALAGLGVICTAAAFLVFFRLIAEVGPARATVITYVNPAVAVALGVLVLGEPLTAAIGVSFALILGGSVLATRPGSARAAPAPERPVVAEEGATVARSD